MFAAGDDDNASGKVEALISFVRSGIANEDTSHTSRSKFIRGSGREVWKAQVAKSSKR